MSKVKVNSIKSITEFHRLRGLPKPEHPLISVVDVESLKVNPENEPEALMLGYYSIALKKNCSGKFKYGQQQYDFDEGIMVFIAPNQVFSIKHDPEEELSKRTGWMLLIHPDFLWNYPLARTIRQYEYFTYDVNEALFLSEKEEATIINLIRSIQQEYHANIDKFSQDIIIAQLDLLLTYCERFYHRQFITRKITNHTVLARLEELLTAYFNSDTLTNKGLPSVQYIADALNVSPNYLSGLLKVLTGQSTQQHIHNKLIEKAKEQLSTTDLTVSEIAYELGFEHSQSFSKLFKSKTNQTPLAFRQSFD